MWCRFPAAARFRIPPAAGGKVPGHPTTRRIPGACPGCRWRARHASESRPRSGGGAHPGLQDEQLRNAVGGEVEQCIEFVTAEGMTFGRALHFDEAAAIVHD